VISFETRFRVFTLALMAFCAVIHAGEEKPKHETIRVGGTVYHVLSRANTQCYDAVLKLKDGNLPSAILIAADEGGNGYRIVFSDGKAVLEAMGNGASKALRSSDLPAFITEGGGKAGTTTLLVRRRWHRLSVLINGCIVIDALENSRAEGIAAIIEDAFGNVEESALREIGDVSFADDFVRKSGELGQWKAATGQWKIHSTIEQWNEGVAFNPAGVARSSNAFALATSCLDGEAFITAGQEFWDDYVFSVAAKSDAGSMGLAFGCVGKDECHRLEWNGGESLLRLARISGGNDETLASARMERRPDQWHMLEVRLEGRKVIACIDGTPRLECESPDANRGSIGLWARGCGEAVFDDVFVSSNQEFNLDEIADVAAGKKWKVEDGNDGQNGINAPAIRKFRPSGRGFSILLPVEADFDRMIASTAISGIPKKGRAGLVCGWKSPKDYLSAEIASGGGDDRAVRICRIAGGKMETLAEAEAPETGGGAILRLDTTREGLIRLYLDGRLFLQAAIGETPTGRIGCLAEGGGEVAFDAPTVCLTEIVEQEHVIANDIFRRDAYMEGWAAPSGAWVKVEKPDPVMGKHAYWHKGDFFGRFEIQTRLRRANPVTRLFFCSDATGAVGNPQTGYRLDAMLTTDGTLNVSLYRGAERAAQESVKLTAQETSDLNIGVESNGCYINSFIAFKNGENTIRRDLIVFRDSDPPGGTMLGIGCDAQPFIEKTEILREGVWDDVFDKALCDWRAEGIWRVTNRFQCDPRWSWMNGTSRNTAVLWSKREFEGDLTVEFYAAMRMALARPPYYPRPGDLNVTICGDGRNLSSGYSFILGGWGTTRTCIMRGDDIVTDTDRELVPTFRNNFPGVDNLHRRWFYIKIRKQGSRLEYYLDNELILEFEDPEPLTGKRIALWTIDNSIMIARVKVSYSSSSPPSVTDSDTPDDEAYPEVKERDIINLSLPIIAYDFNAGLDGWSSTPEGGAESCVVRRGEDDSDLCLRVRNRFGGGEIDVSVQTPDDEDSAFCSELAFDYRIEPGCLINLYLNVKSRPLFIRLTGPDASDLGMTCIGAIEDMQADGEWHTASFPLGVALRRMFPKAEMLQIGKLTFGNLHPGYLRAGFGGNRGGTAYYLDNVTLKPSMYFPISGTVETGVEPVLTWERLDADKKVLKTGEVKPKTALPKLKKYHFSKVELPPGEYLLKVSVGDQVLPAGPVHISPAVPKIAEATPADGAEWGFEPIVIRFENPDDMLAFRPSELTLTVNGREIPVNDGSVECDYSAGALAFDVAKSDAVFKDGEAVPFQLLRMPWRNVLAAWSLKVSYRKVTLAPAMVRLAESPLQNDFEDGPGDFTTSDKEIMQTVFDASGMPIGHDARAECTEETASEGKRSLEVFCLDAGSYCGGVITAKPIDLRQYPMLAFDYRFPPGTTVDLAAKNAGRYWRIAFCDSGAGDKAPIAEIADVKDDDEWHSAEVNLLRGFSGSAWKSVGNSVIDKLVIGDMGWQGAPTGTRYWIDNIRLVPLVPADGCAVKLAARHPSGIKGFGYTWDAEAETEAPKKLMTKKPEVVTKGLPSGDAYLHVRALANSGQWGETSHIRFLVDSEPPAIADLKPGKGETAFPERLEAIISDDSSGVCREKWELRVNGEAIECAPGDVTYDSVSGRVRVRCAKLTTARTDVVEDYEVTLGPLRDNAGNGDVLCRWKWKMDFTRDTVPPTPPEIEWTSGREEVLRDAMDSPELSEHMRESATGLMLRPAYRDPIKSENVLAVYTMAVNDERRAFKIVNQKLDLNETPVICFEARMKDGASCNLEVRSGEESFAIPFALSDPTALENETGAILADNLWHPVWINIRERIAEQARVKGIEPPESADEVSVCFPQGRSARCFLSSLVIPKSGAATPTFRLDARDISGIKAWRWRITSDPALDELGLDSDVSDNPDASPDAPLENGLWFICAQAQDGAGNWSRISRMAFYVME